MAGNALDRFRLALAVVASVSVTAGLTLLVSQQITRAGQGAVEILPPAAPESKAIKVYVSGAVGRPGVYALREGDRVDDAVRAAGGPLEAADLERVNLAVLLRDELHVVVPSRGSGTEAAPADVLRMDAAKIDINTAALADLDKLPGVGPVTANRILEHRRRNGPFVRAEELRDLKLVPSATWEKIKDLIEAR